MPKNKLARRAELITFANVLQPPVKTKNCWQEIFGNQNPITLELACGAGVYTLALAEMFPERNFIGIDIKGVRLWHGAKVALEKKLTNVRFLRTHIEELEKYFATPPHPVPASSAGGPPLIFTPPNGLGRGGCRRREGFREGFEVAEIWLTFPDPFPKKRHTKHRLTHTRFLAIYKNVLVPGGTLHLKTDDLDLLNYSVETLNEADWRIAEINNNIYAAPLSFRAERSGDPESRKINVGEINEVLNIQTLYEKRHLAAGRRIHYLKAVR